MRPRERGSSRAIHIILLLVCHVVVVELVNVPVHVLLGVALIRPHLGVVPLVILRLHVVLMLDQRVALRVQRLPLGQVRLVQLVHHHLVAHVPLLVRVIGKACCLTINQRIIRLFGISLVELSRDIVCLGIDHYFLVLLLMKI